jgi:hypothetical protein
MKTLFGMIVQSLWMPTVLAGPAVNVTQSFRASTQPRCLEESIMADDMALSMNREELKDKKLEISWKPPLKGKWKRFSASGFLWENLSPTVPGETHEAELRLVPMGKGVAEGTLVRVLKFTNPFAWCGAGLDVRASGQIEMTLHFTFPTSQADLERHVTVLVQGQRKTVQWSMNPDFPLAPRVLVTLSEKEVEQGLELVISNKLRSQGTQVSLKNPFKTKISLLGLKSRFKAAQRRIPPEKLTASYFQPKICKNQGTDYTDDYEDVTCYYNGQEIDGSSPEEARSEFLSNACRKKQPFYPEYLQCFESNDLLFVKAVL